jgi:hypothetical protein
LWRIPFSALLLFAGVPLVLCVLALCSFVARRPTIITMVCVGVAGELSNPLEGYIDRYYYCRGLASGRTQRQSPWSLQAHYLPSPPVPMRLVVTFYQDSTLGERGVGVGGIHFITLTGPAAPDHLSGESTMISLATSAFPPIVFERSHPSCPFRRLKPCVQCARSASGLSSDIAKANFPLSLFPSPFPMFFHCKSSPYRPSTLEPIDWKGTALASAHALCLALPTSTSR